MILIKNIKLFNAFLTVCILINLYSYAVGRLQLTPILIIGTIQILLGALINALEYKIKDLDE